MEENHFTGSHKMQMINRKECFLTGVKDVISFDTEVILLETDMGMLTINGKELHIKRLTLEKKETDIEGLIDSFTYSDYNKYKKSKEPFLGRLFK
ncbi:MAG: sporulation protein YabP [Lachnospiraceae bacterium]|jgi:sporulation protein YabP|nr:sporulation protein YabP [Lachnospiraceae bacterium]MCI8825900.1 sporulation protein YabP [Lachnospiraceae bacterium]MCI9368837.1 sporulation protein YabP [Lachnospiraceae bacterium]MDE7309058.1 sporulation protein YabP [Lachnospiraceae bacterium]